MVTCPSCGVENRENSKFCNECGIELVKEVICPNCNTSNPPRAKFCNECGTRLQGVAPAAPVAQSIVAVPAPEQPTHAAAADQFAPVEEDLSFEPERDEPAPAIQYSNGTHPVGEADVDIYALLGLEPETANELIEQESPIHEMAEHPEDLPEGLSAIDEFDITDLLSIPAIGETGKLPPTEETPPSTPEQPDTAAPEREIESVFSPEPEYDFRPHSSLDEAITAQPPAQEADLPSFLNFEDEPIFESDLATDAEAEQADLTNEPAQEISTELPPIVEAGFTELNVPLSELASQEAQTPAAFPEFAALLGAYTTLPESPAVEEQPLVEPEETTVESFYGLSETELAELTDGDRRLLEWQQMSEPQVEAGSLTEPMPVDHEPQVEAEPVEAAAPVAEPEAVLSLVQAEAPALQPEPVALSQEEWDELTPDDQQSIAWVVAGMQSLDAEAQAMQIVSPAAQSSPITVAPAEIPESLLSWFEQESGEVAAVEAGSTSAPLMPVVDEPEFYDNEDELQFQETQAGSIGANNLDVPSWMETLSEPDAEVHLTPEQQAEAERLQAEFESDETPAPVEAASVPAQPAAPQPENVPLEPVAEPQPAESDELIALPLPDVDLPVEEGDQTTMIGTLPEEEETGPREIAVAQSFDLASSQVPEYASRNEEIGRAFAAVLSSPATAYRMAAPSRQATKPRFSLWPFILLVAMLLAVAFANDQGRTVAGVPLSADRNGLGAQTSVQAAYDAVDLVPAGGHVLLVYDWDGFSSQAEMQPLSDAITRHLMQREARIMTISTLPVGAVLAQTTLNQLSATSDYRYGTYNERPYHTYINLGYLPGNEAGLAALSANLAGAKPVDSYFGRPLSSFGASLGVKSVDDLDLIVLLAGDESRVRIWVEQVLARHPKLHMIAAVPQGVQPQVLPRAGGDAGQLNALLAGLSGAAEYQALSQNLNTDQGERKAALDLDRLSMMQGYGLLLLIPVMIAGNLVYLIRSRERKNPGDTTGGNQ